MSTSDDLDRLSSKELHDRAVKAAERHGDVKFLWRLLEAAPAAEAAAGRTDEAAYDVSHWASQVVDAFRGHDEAAQDELRPLYLEYLRRRPTA
jgi:hypothetical protein